MHEIKKCSLCGQASFCCLYSRDIQDVPPWNGFLCKAELRRSISTVLCKSCGWIFQNPTYEASELNRLYNLDNQPASPEALSMADVNAIRRGRELYGELSRWISASKKKILDVGGRNGELMQPFLDAGHDVSVLDMDGGEPENHEIKKIRKVFTHMKVGGYELLTMLHVLEHVESPLLFLKHAHSLLALDGLLYIEVPSELLTPLVFRHIGDHRHIGYFSRSTLQGTLEAAGFSCLFCNMKVGFVGAKLPVIRALARKASTPLPWRPRRWAALHSVVEIFHPIPIFVRAVNYFKR